MSLSRPTAFESPVYHYVFGTAESCVELSAGQSVRVVCADCDNRFPDGTELPDSRRALSPRGAYFQGNPVAGPIGIVGAIPGNTIALSIDAIDIPACVGRTGLAAGHGLLPGHLLAPEESVPARMYEWAVDPFSRTCRLINPLGTHEVQLPMHPFVGCIGIAPQHGQQISTLYAGNHGGNMDLPSLSAGVVLELPVFTNGALLMVGDLHAGQGHGEAIGGAIEVPGYVDLSILSVTRKSIAGPRVITCSEIGAIASEGDLRSAIATAYARLVAWLAEELGMNRFDAYNMASQCARVEIGNLVVSPFTVAVFVKREHLPPRLQASLGAVL